MTAQPSSVSTAVTASTGAFGGRWRTGTSRTVAGRGGRYARAARAGRARGGTAVEVPLTVLDFLDRAETVFAAREAVVDEPDPPGGGLGRITYGELAAKARSLTIALDDLGIGPG